MAYTISALLEQLCMHIHTHNIDTQEGRIASLQPSAYIMYIPIAAGLVGTIAYL